MCCRIRPVSDRVQAHGGRQQGRPELLLQEGRVVSHTDSTPPVSSDTSETGAAPPFADPGFQPESPAAHHTEDDGEEEQGTPQAVPERPQTHLVEPDKTELFSTPFIASFLGQVGRNDDGLHDSSPQRRAGAWAHWAVSRLTAVETGRRSYPAIVLPGRFYDPRNSGLREMSPHLEIPRRVLRHPDSEFPDRLAQFGNALEFPSWLYTEVVACRRALFNTPSGSVADLVDALNDRRGGLVEGLEALTRTISPHWHHIEKQLVASPDGLAAEATGPFDTAEVGTYFGPAPDLQLNITFDQRLAEKNGAWASRRIGVWQIEGVSSGGEPFALGVLTPRLTSGSVLRDPMFTPKGEAPASLLVRALLLRRIAKVHLNAPTADTFQVGDPDPVVQLGSTPGGPHLQARVVKSDQKTPEASVAAAVHFLQQHPDADVAWRVLCQWADGGYLLTVTEAGFKAAHANARRFVRRAEEPERDDINQLLPLAWDEDTGQAVRVTYSLPKND